MARPDRRDRGGLLATRCSTGCCSGGSTSGGATEELVANWGSIRRWSSGWTGWSRAPSSSARCRRSRSSGPRTAGVDYLYPRRRPGLVGPVTQAGRTWRCRASAGRSTSSPPRSATSATSRSGRSRSLGGPAHRGRGHPPHAPAARALRDRDPDHELPRPERPGRERELLRAPSRRRRPRARDRRRDAGRSATRARAWWRRGPPRAARSCRSRARRRCWRPSWRSGWRGRAGRSRGSCRGAAATVASGWPRIAADERGDVHLRGAGPGRGHAPRPGRGVRCGPAGRRLPGADQDPRDGRARDARRTGGWLPLMARSRPAASSCWSWATAPASGTARGRVRRPPRPSMPWRWRAPRWSDSSRAGSRVARRPGRSPLPPGCLADQTLRGRRRSTSMPA